MPAVDVVVSSPIRRTFRVDQVAGMFDLKLAKKTRDEFHAELPDLEEDWQIGVIVGPSGSGKSTVARHAFAEALCGDGQWPADKAIVDGFGDRSIKEITHVLTSVGFSSPPSWVKPYAVLSNGEKFRCDLARALLGDRELVVYDEFTSVVDRTVAKIGSAAVSKAIRKGKIARRFVAVTCHYDVVKWLEPDWVLDMASGRLARGRLRRPEIRLEITPVFHPAWSLFRRHHYLNTAIQVKADCYCAFIGDEPVAFSAWVNHQFLGVRPGDMREHRTVVLPDFQGIGIGNRLSEYCASIYAGLGGRAVRAETKPTIDCRPDRAVPRRHACLSPPPLGNDLGRGDGPGRLDGRRANHPQKSRLQLGLLPGTLISACPTTSANPESPAPNPASPFSFRASAGIPDSSHSRPAQRLRATLAGRFRP